MRRGHVTVPNDSMPVRRRGVAVPNDSVAVRRRGVAMASIAVLWRVTVTHVAVGVRGVAVTVSVGNIGRVCRGRSKEHQSAEDSENECKAFHVKFSFW